MITESGDAALIGVDWGTTSFRAFLLDADGAVLDSRSGPRGILTVQGGDFGAVLLGEVGGWLADHAVPILMSGMIGSRQGWVEAPYVACPAGLADLAAALVPVPFDRARVFIVPGVEVATATMRDVMRGEETQVFGALSASGEGSGRFLLPGTHSKWVTVERGRIDAFATYMTGELYAACRTHTILGRLMQEDVDSPEHFARGVREGAASGTPGALLHRLFGARTAGLFGDIPASRLADYLSGLLIGAELADAGLGGPPAVRIIASDRLAGRYKAAAAELGRETDALDPACVAAGHMAIARSVGLLSHEARVALP